MDLRKTFHHVFTPDYIFDFSQMTLSQGDRLYMLAGLVMVMFATIFQVISLYSKNPVSRSFWHRLSTPLGLGGILEAIWYVARYENIGVFGSHFAAWLIGIVVLVWLYFPIRYFFSHYKTERVSWQKQQLKLKYLK